MSFFLDPSEVVASYLSGCSTMEAVRCKTYVRKSNQQQISTLKAVDMEVIVTSMSAGEVTRGWRTEGGREGTAGSLEGTLRLGVGGKILERKPRLREKEHHKGTNSSVTRWKNTSINNSVKGNKEVREVEDGDQAWASVQKKTLSGMAGTKSVEESWQKETALKLDPNHLLCSLLATTVSSLIQVFFIMVSDSKSLRTWHLHFIHFDSTRGQSCDGVCSRRGRCFFQAKINQRGNWTNAVSKEWGLWKKWHSQRQRKGKNKRCWSSY